MSIIDLPALILGTYFLLLGLFWAFRVMMVAAVKMTSSAAQTVTISAYAAIALGIGIWAFAMVFS